MLIGWEASILPQSTILCSQPKFRALYSILFLQTERGKSERQIKSGIATQFANQ